MSLPDSISRRRVSPTAPDEVPAGLTVPRKSLPSKYLYDAEGSRLFEAICELPEYYVLSQEAPNAQLILYPDANHGSQYQYPDLFVADVARFLDAETPFPTAEGH